MPSDRFRDAIDAIDAANADDPNTISVHGEQRPKELAHAEMVTAWVERLLPDPSDEVLLAARAHHLRRWTVPRSSFPSGRAGYLQWRRSLHRQHAEDVGRILSEQGYDAASIQRVQDLVQKRGLGRSDDPEVQALEDALCLVFIETQFRELAARLDRQYGGSEKMVEVVRKTLGKMSDTGKRRALAIGLDPADRVIIEAALEPEEEAE